jgi:hypothetical protein
LPWATCGGTGVLGSPTHYHPPNHRPHHHTNNNTKSWDPNTGSQPHTTNRRDHMGKLGTTTNWSPGGPKGPQKLPKVFGEFDNRPFYLGHSARSLHIRMQEHMASASRGDQSNCMARHIKACHSTDTVPPQFTMVQVTSHTKNLVRRATEAILLERQDPVFSLNDCMEWGRKNNVVRPVTVGV